MNERLKELLLGYAHCEPEAVTRLTAAGSNRVYYRFAFADGHTVACGGINGEHDAENGSVHLVRNLPDNVNIHDVKAISIFGETYCFDEADGK